MKQPDPKTPPIIQFADTEAAITSDALDKTYSDGLIFKRRFHALKNVSFSVGKGEIFGLLGPNGAGKTTFIKILLGIIRKSGGHATLMGQPAGSQAGRRLTGYLPEHLRIAPHLTGYTALECYGNLSNVPTSVVRQKQDHLLELVGLASRAKDRCRKYSKGMLQRLGLAQALLHDPRLLILDEPTDGLDPQARAEMRETIRRLKSEGVTIFLNSHLLQEVEMICQRVAILDQGQLRYCGTVREIGDFVKSAAGSSMDEIGISVDVIGDPEAIHNSFADQSFQITSRGEDGSFSVSLSLSDQGAVDQLVDRLRGNEVSIRSLSRQQVTLEDAFLKLVGDTKND